MTDNEFQSWLASASALRLILIEVGVVAGGVTTTRYLSNRPYVTGPGDSPANLAYEPVLAGPPSFSEQLSLDGETSLSYGDVALENHEGQRDSWLNDVWVNQPVKAWLGDARWARGEFRLLFDGVVADIDSRDRTTLNLKLRDKMQRLNTPITERKLEGDGANKDALLPLAFGEVHNVTPLLADPVTLEYQVHDGAIEGVIEVRDNGKPVTVTAIPATGKFRLLAQPAGAITASVQGEKAGNYRNTVGRLIRRIVTAYGKAEDRFTESDLDTASFDAFEADHPQPVGWYVAERDNVLEVCRQLAASVGVCLAMTRTGKLRLVKLELPAGGVPFDVTESHIRQGSLRLAGRPGVAAAVKVGFCRNWTVQPGLQTSIPAGHRDLFASEWLTETVSDAAVQQAYRLHGEPVQRNTCLLRRTDAQAEALRELALRKVQRSVFEFDGYAELLQLELGQAVTLRHRRYGLGGGVPGVVVSLAPEWDGGTVKVGVMV